MSDTENQTALIAQFVSITSADENTARFYLDSAAWDVQTAVESFFENGPEITNNRDRNNLNISAEEHVSNLSDQEDDIQIVEEHKPKISPMKESVEVIGSGPSNPPKPTVPKQPANSKRFATLSDLGSSSKRNNDESSESDSGNESPMDSSKSKKAQQSFYVGGGEHSGQEVLGPKKAGKMVDRIFKEAKALGAVEGGSNSSPTSGVSKDVFSGAGIRLGDSTTGSQMVPGRATEPRTAPEIVPVRVAMYNNGFLVGDEQTLRQYTDPQSKAFISAIMKGQIPHELTARFPGSEIDLHMENHQNEEYVPPKASLQAFSGQGYMLGGVVPNVVGAGQMGGGPKTAATTSSSAENQLNQNRPIKSLEIDESKPTTRLRIRLLNGQQLVGRFNTSHRISDVRSFIILQNNEFGNIPFNLLANVPPAKLTDENLTLEEAGLLNASIVQGKAV